MTETTRQDQQERQSEEQATGKDLLQQETTAEGRYIPYSGGSLGWFENSGVLKCERGNNYKFYTALDSARVRERLFQRWGSDVNRRMEQRVAVERETPVRITWDGGSTEATTQDLSSHGLRLQLLDEPDLQKGSKLQVHVFEKPDYQNEVLNIDSEVMWVARLGKRRLVWNLGIGFVDITPREEIKLKEFLLG